MKKTVTKEVYVCDCCDREEVYAHNVCLKCGKQYCYDCRKDMGIEYAHDVYCTGSGDGFYCHPCDKELTAAGTDQIHSTYRKIRALRNERLGFEAEFEKRRKEATEKLERLQKLQ